MLLIATRTLPASVALMLAREAEIILAIAPDLTPAQLMAAERQAFDRAGAAVVVLRADLPT